MITMSVLEVIPLLQAFSSATFRICGASRSPSAPAELFVCSVGRKTQPMNIVALRVVESSE